jgi:septal ring-binding cell division protein DamX
MPEVAAQGLKWLQGLPGDQFLLEFQTFSNVSNAEKFIASSELLKRAQIVPIYANDKPDLQFLVVDGPYRTTDIANKAASRLPGSAEVSIESVDSLRLFTTQNLAPPPKS